MLKQNDFIEAGKLIGCKVSRVRAVYSVEAASNGYLPDGRVKILFEGHRFWKLLKNAGADPAAFIKNFPAYKNVLYEDWDKTQYKGGAREWDRMSMAIEACKIMNVPPEVALKAASYGSFQILGENFEACGYSTVQDMVTSYNSGGEPEQLKSFIRFVKAKKLDDELIKGDWAAFAKGYNGTAFRKNKYDIKLAAADQKYSMAA